MRGYEDITLWVKSLWYKTRSRFQCGKWNGRYKLLSRTVICIALINVDPEQLNQALNAWNLQYDRLDESLPIDGKIMCNAIDDKGRESHIMGVIGHESGHYCSQKMGTFWVIGLNPEHRPEEKQTNEIKIAASMQDVIEIDRRTNTSRYTAYTVRIGSISGGGKRCQLSSHGKKEPIKSARRSRFLFLLEHTNSCRFYLHGQRRAWTNWNAEIWVTTKLNHYFNFPYVRQTFMIEKEFICKKTG